MKMNPVHQTVALMPELLLEARRGANKTLPIGRLATGIRSDRRESPGLRRVKPAIRNDVGAKFSYDEFCDRVYD